MSKDTSPILGPHTSTCNIMNRRGKKLRQFVEEIGEKKKKKKIGVAMRLRTRKNLQKFLKPYIF